MMHWNIKLFGKVQGVFFRKFIQKKAFELNVKGFVRNDQDGSVYIEAEAEKEKLEESEFGGFNYFPSFGLSVEINLCEICMEEFRELLERFFKEVQIIKANY